MFPEGVFDLAQVSAGGGIGRLSSKQMALAAILIRANQ